MKKERKETRKQVKVRGSQGKDEESTMGRRKRKKANPFVMSKGRKKARGRGNNSTVGRRLFSKVCGMTDTYIKGA